MPAKKTEASLLFLEGGQLLFETDNWLARYAGALGVPVTRIRDIRRGRADLNRDGVEDGLLKDALELAEHLNQKAQEESAAAQRRAERTARACEVLMRAIKK
jgi:hypothetical protein